MKIVFSAA
ncbi:hypothetical protein Nmel_010345 [Mimus melanotis]